MAPAMTPPPPPQPVQQLPPPPPVQQQMNHAAQPNQTSEQVRSPRLPTMSRLPPPGTPPPPYESGERSETTGDSGGRMDTSFQPELQASYYQHKAAKLASFRPVAFNITWNNSIGNQEKYYSGNLGIFDNQGDRLVMKGFNGSRDKQRGTSNTNQSISCSFDPSPMLCITCTSEHDVIPPRVVSHHKPIAFAFGDQNFLACQPTYTGDCIRTIRLENSSLLELADIALDCSSTPSRRQAR